MRLRSADPPAPTLALLAAVALDEVAAAYVPRERLRIKWPNDLLLRRGADDDPGGRDGGWAKVAGILLERVEDAVIIGFGVNLAHAPMLVDRPAAALADDLGAAPDPPVFVDTLAASVARWLARWRGEGLEIVRARWMERSHPIGTPLLARTADGIETAGLFDGLDASGALRLITAERLRIIAAGDVFLL